MSSLHLRLALLLGLTIATVQAEDAEGWKLATKGDDLTVYQRPRAGSDLREYRAIGVIAAPPLVTARVLDDSTEYPRFMPYVSECRVLAQDALHRVSYQRLAIPMIGDRDYTLRIRTATERLPNGSTIHLRSWSTANNLGPAEIAGVTRVKVSDGSWRLEPLEGGRKTRAVYQLFSDASGKLPAMILNAGNKTAIPKLFEAVRKQSRAAKYQLMTE